MSQRILALLLSSLAATGAVVLGVAELSSAHSFLAIAWFAVAALGGVALHINIVGH